MAIQRIEIVRLFRNQVFKTYVRKADIAGFRNHFFFFSRMQRELVSESTSNTSRVHSASVPITLSRRRGYRGITPLMILTNKKDFSPQYFSKTYPMYRVQFYIRIHASESALWSQTKSSRGKISFPGDIISMPLSNEHAGGTLAIQRPSRFSKRYP